MGTGARVWRRVLAMTIVAAVLGMSVAAAPRRKHAERGGVW